jgi:hypothetical protein
MLTKFIRTASLITAAVLVVAMAATANAATVTSQARTAHNAAQRHLEEPAYFVMSDVTGHTFIVEITNPADIRHARELVRGQTHDLPHILARIVKHPAPYNPQWSYHIDPSTIEFFDVSTEVCDATIPYVQEHLSEAGGAFLPGLIWCDWSSHLVREIPAP